MICSRGNVCYMFTIWRMWEARPFAHRKVPAEKNGGFLLSCQAESFFFRPVTHESEGSTTPPGRLTAHKPHASTLCHTYIDEAASCAGSCSKKGIIRIMSVVTTKLVRVRPTIPSDCCSFDAASSVCVVVGHVSRMEGMTPIRLLTAHKPHLSTLCDV